MVGNLKKITVFFKFPTVFLRKKEEEKGDDNGRLKEAPTVSDTD